MSSVLDCFDEAALCLQRETFHRRQYEDFAREHPEDNAEMMLRIIDYYRERRQRAIARMHELQKKPAQKADAARR